jgi:hypothetical protein
MIAQPEIWTALKSILKAEESMPLKEIYRRLEGKIPSLKDEPSLPWKRNVRNVVQRRIGSGEIIREGKGAYRLGAV